MSCKYHFNWTTDTPCPYCRIEELEQQLADEKKAAGYWMEQSCKDHNRAEKAEQQISRYQGGVEVEGVIVHVTDWISTKSGLYFPLPEKPFAKGQRVHVHVMEVE